MYRYLYPIGDFLFLLKYEYIENNINQEEGSILLIYFHLNLCDILIIMLNFITFIKRNF